MGILIPTTKITRPAKGEKQAAVKNTSGVNLIADPIMKIDSDKNKATLNTVARKLLKIDEGYGITPLPEATDSNVLYLLNVTEDQASTYPTLRSLSRDGKADSAKKSPSSSIKSLVRDLGFKFKTGSYLVTKNFVSVIDGVTTISGDLSNDEANDLVLAAQKMEIRGDYTIYKTTWAREMRVSSPRVANPMGTQSPTETSENTENTTQDNSKATDPVDTSEPQGFDEAPAQNTSSQSDTLDF